MWKQSGNQTLKIFFIKIDINVSNNQYNTTNISPAYKLNSQNHLLNNSIDFSKNSSNKVVTKSFGIFFVIMSTFCALMICVVWRFLIFWWLLLRSKKLPFNHIFGVVWLELFFIFFGFSFILSKKIIWFLQIAVSKICKLTFSSRSKK